MSSAAVPLSLEGGLLGLSRAGRRSAVHEVERAPAQDLLKQMDAQYKREHELFVLNDGGGSALVVALCILHAPVLVCICKICKACVSADSVLSVVLEFLIVIYPLLLIITVFSKFIIGSFAASTLLLVVVYYAFTYSTKSNTSQKGVINQPLDAVSTKLEFISLFKGINMHLTIMSILGVDFKVFPRSFAKTEAYGIGLMDLGVATFIIASALTSRAARGIDASVGGIGADTDKLSTAKPIRHWTKRFLPFTSGQKAAVLLLGLIRLFVLKAFNYHEHVTEYGVHWNFFVTLFLIWTIADMFNSMLSPHSQLVLAVLSLCAYQYTLSKCGLSSYILNEERTDFVSANKEGIFSLFGCLPLYVIAQQLSKMIFFQPLPSDNKANMPPRRGETKFRHKLIPKLLSCTLALWAMWGLTNTFVQEMSRRFMNISFVAFALAISFSVLSFLAISEGVFEGAVAGSVRTLECMSAYQLQIFLFANVITGSINMAMETMYASNASALLILGLYCFVVICPFYLYYRSYCLRDFARGNVFTT